MGIRCITCGHGGTVAQAAPECECCQNDYHCENCGQPSDNCACCPCHELYPCPEPEDGFSPQYGGSALEPPWVKRGIEVPKNKKYLSWEAAWPVLSATHKMTDICQYAADFYILDALRSRLLNREHDCEGRCYHFEFWPFELRDVSEEATVEFRTKVEFLDLVFREYVEMACGGELRHHGACGGKSLSGHRRQAWADWKWIHEIVGDQALLDGAALFDEFPVGSFGGARWAFALRLLHRRITNEISPIIWVDQVFTLVHNGGVFLNKLDWGIKNKCGYSLGHLQSVILPAQEASRWRLLTRAASPPVRHMWDRYWRTSNRARLRSAVTPTLNPRWSSKIRRCCQWCMSDPSRGHLMSCASFCRPDVMADTQTAPVLAVPEDEWGQFNWQVWNMPDYPVSADGRIKMLNTEVYTVILEIHSSFGVKVKRVNAYGSDLMEQTVKFARSIPVFEGWEETDDTEYWFRLMLCDQTENLTLGGFESRRTTNRGVFAKKFITFGHILPLLMPHIDWSNLTEEYV